MNAFSPYQLSSDVVTGLFYRQLGIKGPAAKVNLVSAMVRAVIEGPDPALKIIPYHVVVARQTGKQEILRRILQRQIFITRVMQGLHNPDYQLPLRTLRWIKK